ncbi:MAG: TRAP transporter large permease subunit [Erysipelotrichaceae bacterium]|nr:TRAP transporter large permease subunit [Erysipelotrichaceae bacterium]
MLKNKTYQFSARFFTIFLIVTFLLNEFLKNAMLKNVVTVLTLVMFLIGYLIMNRMNKIVCGILFAVGAFLLFRYQASWPEWQAAILKGLSTMVLLAFAAILSMPFFYKPYQAELKNLCARYVRSPGIFLLVTLFISFLLGFYMSVAAIPLIYSLLCDAAREYKCHKAFVMAVCASNSLAMMCAPSVSAGVVPAATGISYSQMFTYGGIGAIILLFVSGVVFNGYAKKEGAVKKEAVNVEVDKKTLVMMIALFAILIGLILCIDNFTNISLLAGISLLALPFAFVFALLQGKIDVFKERMKGYWDKTMLTNPNVLAITGICCFAGEGLRRAESIRTVLGFFSANQSLYLLFPLIIIAVGVLISIIGVHPHAVGALFASILTADLLRTNPLGLSMIILVAWSVGLAATPFGATANMASAACGLEVTEFTAKANWKWSAAMIVAGALLCDFFTLFF